MKNSEIFDSFVKIAQEKGMISNDSSEAKKKLENTGRAGSDDISTIEALYGVKPDSTEGMDYKSNIMEIAHQNSVVTAPSYDKLNGLVENNIERQNILLNIVNKPVNGYLTQHKYAETELLMSLVRLGNELDDGNHEELRTFADNCLVRMSGKQIKKQAYAVAVVAGVAAILGGVYLKNHMRFVSDGLEKDHAKLIAEIDDLLTSNSNWGVGVQYKQAFTQMVQDFKGKLDAFYNAYRQIDPIIDEVQKPRDAKELLAKAQEPDTGNIQQAIANFRKATDFILPEIQKIIKNFASEEYKARQTQDKGWMNSLVDATQVLHGGKGLVADDMDDVRHALETYLLDIGNVRKVLAETGTIQQQVSREMQEAASKSNEMFGSQTSETPAAPVAQNTAPAAGQPKTVQDLDNEADELSNSLTGLLK